MNKDEKGVRPLFAFALSQKGAVPLFRHGMRVGS